ncbi:MAG: SCO1664 family protein [Anaerolineales bacterium]|nr:SCO1664 family protein [Anaerolineales bacterium]
MYPIQLALEHGEYRLKGQFMLGSNYTFLADVEYEGEIYPAVYKPSRGEQPLWDFPENTLSLREVAAYQLSEALDLHIVPFTVYRNEGPYGAGSLQEFIEYDIEYHYFNFTTEDKEKLRPIVFFDLLLNNADRKGGHIFFERDTKRLYAIDHGVCFHQDDKLRTVIWDFAGETISDKLLAPLARTSNWSARFEPYLSPSEISALVRRAEKLAETKLFPHPPPGRRAYPYPPI